jgi:hypothetical protein
VRQTGGGSVAVRVKVAVYTGVWDGVGVMDAVFVAVGGSAVSVLVGVLLAVAVFVAGAVLLAVGVWLAVAVTLAVKVTVGVDELIVN